MIKKEPCICRVHPDVFFFIFSFLFIFWLPWVSIATHGLLPVLESGGYSGCSACGLRLQRLLSLHSMDLEWANEAVVLSLVS